MSKSNSAWKQSSRSNNFSYGLSENKQYRRNFRAGVAYFRSIRRKTFLQPLVTFYIIRKGELYSFKGDASMKAAIITQPGGPEVLAIQEVETPEPVGEQVRVRVRASGINRADLLQRAGGYPAPAGSPSHIPGMEFAGEVDTVGSLVR